MSTFNNLPPFQIAGIKMYELRDKWLQWKRAFLYVVNSENITNPVVRKCKLLALGGFELQDVFHAIPGADVDEPDRVNKKSVFDIAIEKLDAYFAPKHHDAYERYLYWSLKQNEGESLHSFLLRAQQQAAKCHFGKNEMESREISVIDKAIMLAKPDLREKLLRSEMSLGATMACVSTYESINFQNKEISSGNKHVNQFVNFVNKSSAIECYRCGNTGHLANSDFCRAKNSVCRNCGKTGHFEKKCRTRRRIQTVNKHQKRPRYSNSVHNVKSEEVICNIDFGDETMYISVADCLIEMLIDSGCKHNMIDQRTWLRIQNQINSKFEWTADHDHEFLVLKENITNIRSLGFFDVEDKTRLIADASPYALGAVLLQFKNGSPRVISYAHKSLTDTEKRYCQTEKEALALVWAVEKFSIYLLGLEFELETDHKPLETIFTPRSKTCARIERWVLRLQSYKYKVVYRKGASNIADPLSRLCKLDNPKPFDEECQLYINQIVNSAAIDISEVEEASSQDFIFQKLRNSIQLRKWNELDEDLKPYSRFRDELCLHNTMVLRGLKIMVPEKLRPRFLDLAHEGHPGETVMKRRLRERVWWPNIDTEVVKYVKTCQGCILVSLPCNPEPMLRKELPSKPWVDLAIDFLGPLPTGEYLLVIVDYFSRYKEVEIMTKITSAMTISRLNKIFVRLGFPFTITLDNAKQFVSNEFEEYCSNKRITLNNTIPYWPQQNGEVERQNRSLLKRLRISAALNLNWRYQLNDYLLMYNTTPHSTTGMTPTELCIGRTIRGKIPSIKDLDSYNKISYDELRDKDFLMKQKGKDIEDARRHAEVRDIQPGDTVMVQQTIPGNKLTTTFMKNKFKVLEKIGPKVTVQDTGTNKIFTRNIAHLKRIENDLKAASGNDNVGPYDNTQHVRVSKRNPSKPDRLGINQS